MTTENIHSESSTALGVAMFGGLLIIALSILLIYLPSYINNNPPVCEQEAIIKEILVSNGSTAKVKLDNGSIKDLKVNQYSVIEKKFNYDLQVDKSVCLVYKSSLDYFLSYMFF